MERHSLRSMRCLLPVRGWYEWNKNEQARNDAGRKVKQPYFISEPDSEVIVFAGLWALWKGQDGAEVLSCVLSKGASPSIDHIHDHIHVVLKPEHFGPWVDPKISRQRVQEIISDALADFKGYPVSTKVNNTRNDFPELLEPSTFAL